MTSSAALTLPAVETKARAAPWLVALFMLISMVGPGVSTSKVTALKYSR